MRDVDSCGLGGSATEPSTKPGSGDAAGANAFFKRARPILVKYYAEQMNRFPKVPSGASAKQVYEILINAIPALHGFQNRYPRQ